MEFTKAALTRRHLLLLLAICLAYFALEFVYNAYAMLSVDDFWLAYHNYEYKERLPYRDFSPYKTVLGYYIFLLPFVLFKGYLSPLVYAKCWIALLNTFFLAGTSLWLKRLFHAKAVFLTLFLLIPTQAFLCYSCEIRVDLLAWWLCLLSVLCILENRYVGAGLCLGVGFLICQKVFYYFLATNAGLLGMVLFSGHQGKNIKEIVRFNATAACILLLYIFFWAYFSSLKTVLHSVFYEAYFLASIDWYWQVRALYWNSIINNNPAISLLWPFAFFGLFIVPVKKRAFMIGYALVIVFFIMTCKQPFVYFLLGALPALVITYCAFFSGLLSPLHLTAKDKQWIRFFSLLYLFYLLGLSYGFGLLPLYFVAALIPMLLCASFTLPSNASLKRYFNRAVLFVLLLIGLVFPVMRFIAFLPQMNGQYQKATLSLMNHLLASEDSYIAGVPLLHHIKQPIPGLVHLVGPSIDYLNHPSKTLYTIMKQDALYFNPATTDEIIHSIQQTPVKLYVDNGRFHLLPAVIQRYLASEFTHFWGSIFLYAPRIAAGKQRVGIKIAGNYQVKAKKEAVIAINGQKIAPNAFLNLKAQPIDSDANSPYRLKLKPSNVDPLLDKAMQKNRWERVTW
ncbi:MAG: hypothetical protein WC785_00750 [Tatlockia sp.]|jgi:hypothetical protein